MVRAMIQTALNDIRAAARCLGGGDRDYDELLDAVDDRQFVLLGEASHGTHEFYQMRADITRRLISELNFDAVVVEGDWPDVYRVNRYVLGESADETARDALRGFDRFPRWMWRNTEVQRFVEWLRMHNLSRNRAQRTGVYGLDLYSLHRSISAVVDYLEEVDPEAAVRARERYGCMDHSGDPQGYGHAVAMSVQKSCEDEAVAQLQDVLHKRMRLAEQGALDEDAQFSAEINARVVRNAEAYYRGMFSSRTSTWNLRDSHMAQVLFALHENISRRKGRPARIAVWAHNSHLGDARATEVSRHGELNLGQLVRERAADNAMLVGFTTYTGHVTAARDWGAPAEHRWVRPALDESVEKLFERTGLDRFYLSLSGALANPASLRGLLERAIGVIYRPESERQSHYFKAVLPEQFDAVFHLDETSALEPLDLTETWDEREPPETYPFGT